MNCLPFLLHLLDKSAFLRCSEFFFTKKTKSGQKVLSGLVDPKEAFIDIYQTGFQT